MVTTPAEAFRQRAHEALAAARDALRDGHLETAASRAYYACYYAIHAQLETLSESAGSHKQTGILFRKYFIKSEALDTKYSTTLRELSSWRMEADYAPTPHIDRPLATDLVAQAGDFVEALLTVAVGQTK